MKNTFCMGNPKMKLYRVFTNFDCEIFESDLSYSLQTFQSLDIFLLLLNKYAPNKKKVSQSYHDPFMTKTLRKAKILRLQLKN